MRLFIALIFVLLSFVGQLGAQELYLTSNFAEQMDETWQLVRLNQTDRFNLVSSTKRLFDIDSPPRFPGAARKLLVDAGQMDAAGMLDVAHDARRIACIIDRCGAWVNWRLFTQEVASGGGVKALQYLSDFVLSLGSLVRWVGGSLSLSAGFALGLVLASLMFGILVLVRHAYIFGVAVSARVPLASAHVFGLLPFLVVVYGLKTGAGILSVFLGVLLVLPFVATREALVVCGCAGLFWGMVAFTPDALRGGGLNQLPEQQPYFSTSAEQRRAINPIEHTAIMERQFVDDVRFSKSEEMLKAIQSIRSSHPTFIESPKAAGVLNLEGIGHAIRGQHTEAIALFEKSTRLAPDRYEPLYNQIKLLKSVNQDDKAQAMLSKALAFDTREVGARVAADFNYKRDLEGFAVFSGVPWWGRMGTSLSVNGVLSALGGARFVLGSSFKSALAMPVCLLLCLSLLLVRLVFRNTPFYLPCSSCGDATLQTNVVYHTGMLDCDLCRLDVTSASRLERGDLHRHSLRVSLWTMLNRMLDICGTWVYPGLRLLATRAPVRSFLFNVLFLWFLVGSILSGTATASPSWAVGSNLFLLGMTWLCGVLVVRQREAS